MEQEIQQIQQLQQMEVQLEMQQMQQLDDIEVNEKFNEECLESHNEFRELHGCPPLSLSLELAVTAQAWANHLASIGRLQHSESKGKYGENIAMKMVSGSQEYKGSQCTAQWYSEIEMYDFEGGENQMKCGHFSQVVWKATKEAGFGKAISPDGKMFAVGQYTPAGNFMNKWRANIPAPLSGAIRVPTSEDVMGRRSQEPLSITIGTKGGSTTTTKGGSGSLQLGQSQDQEPQPTDPRDQPVGKATKTRIVNGEKTVTVTVTFARPDGSRYQLSKETATQRDIQQATVKRPDAGRGEVIIQPTKLRRNFAAPGVGGTDGDDAVDGGFALAERRAAFAQEAARQHDLLRRRHGAPELRRSDSLDELAQLWADSLSRSGHLQHNRPVAYGNGQVGQNIAKRPAAVAAALSGGLGDDEAGKRAAQQLMQQWFSERHQFPFGQSDPEDIVGGHFSQLIWCSTEKLGVGLAVDSDTGDEYAVCFYYPCGNLAGQFADNVLPSFD